MKPEIGHFTPKKNGDVTTRNLDQSTAANYLLFLSAISVSLFFFNDVTEHAPRNDADGIYTVIIVHNVLQTTVNAACGSAIIILCSEMYLVVFHFQRFDRRLPCGEIFVLIAAAFCFIDMYFFSFSYFVTDTTEPEPYVFFLAEFVPLVCLNLLLVGAIASVVSTYGLVRYVGR